MEIMQACLKGVSGCWLGQEASEERTSATTLALQKSLQGSKKTIFRTRAEVKLYLKKRLEEHPALSAQPFHEDSADAEQVGDGYPVKCVLLWARC